MKDKIKKILKIALRVILGLFAVCFLVGAVYTGVVYIDYLSNRDSIFSRIDEFSKAMKVQSETDENMILTAVDEVESSRQPSYILDRNGEIIAKYSPEKYRLASLEEMPYFLTRGFVTIEDKAFFKHFGINLKTFTAAILKNVITMGKSPGGSTISQQLSKILFTKHERSVKRKIYEIFCTLEMERRFSKNEILKIYLNSIYLGHGTYGIANAAEFYFGKTPAELTVAEAALFIGMNRAPERYSPIRNRERAEYIQRVVLGEFVRNGFIERDFVDEEVERFWARFNETGVKGIQSFWKTEINKSGYLTEYIRLLLIQEEEFDYEKITRGGLIIETTFDLERQIIAEKVMTDQIMAIRNKVKKTAESSKTYKGKYPDSLLNKLEGSLVSMDYRTGEVYAVVGGSGYNYANQLNRAVYSYRPIGSSVKPFIYAYALSQGELDGAEIHPFSKFKDEIVEYKIAGKKYKPRNYSAKHEYGKMVTLYDAVKTSLNTVAVAVMDKMDIKETAQFLRDTASMDKERGKRVPEVLSLALGTCEMSALELAASYSVFPRGGESVYPIKIKKISDWRGNVYYDINRQTNQFFDWLYPAEFREPKEVLKPEVSYEVVQMLEGVFEEGGTGFWPAYITGLRKKAYGKSGTSQSYKDGWFAGFTNNEVVTVWVGIDSNQSILLPGSTTAGIIWSDYNARVPANIITQIPIPKNMKLVTMDVKEGLIATENCPQTKEFYFMKDGPLPEECYVHSSDELAPFLDDELSDEEMTDDNGENR